MQFQKYVLVGHCSKTFHYTDLNIWDGHRVFEDDPLHGLRAGWGRQRAVIDEVLLCGVGQETLQGERRDGAALSWPEKTGIVQMKITIVLLFTHLHGIPKPYDFLFSIEKVILVRFLDFRRLIAHKLYGPLLWCISHSLSFNRNAQPRQSEFLLWSSTEESQTGLRVSKMMTECPFLSELSL